MGILPRLLPKTQVQELRFGADRLESYSSGSFFITSNRASMMSVMSLASSSRSAIGALPKSIAP